MIIMGVDPGVHGALALWTPADRHLAIWDVPTWLRSVGRSKKRLQIDEFETLTLFDIAKQMDVKLVVFEQVGPRPAQSGGFTFGYTYGVLVQSARAVGIPVEQIPAAVWKKSMRCPSKEDSAIVHRADELFPLHGDLFRGPQGGLKVDRAEAAMIAKFGETNILNL